MGKNVYFLYRPQIKQGNEKAEKNSILFYYYIYHYLNCYFNEQQFWLGQFMQKKSWYETVNDKLFETKTARELNSFGITYFNWFTVWVARFLALFIKGNWYKINKVQVI